ncbi:hypothetical protein RHGRI_034815 [Rhododendron griersonianum]|uniref:Uncharacterized protein n=1 Tax=Rhododendron griersonianum TaxID=479676 RepID=A0AAV6I854_9ERIC|nr:hypothetical protein RHGRI_034815 [Rhododendron griersonianum]
MACSFKTGPTLSGSKHKGVSPPPPSTGFLQFKQSNPLNCSIQICQLAESNENAIILKVNYEQLKKMCHCLHIHVLPFFRFYRGAEGRLCSFSCTIATIKKFKDALAKHGTDRCYLGLAKGLDESELLSLASIGEISFSNLPLPSTKKDIMQDLVLKNTDLSGGFGISGNSIMGIEEEVLA